MSEVFTCLHVKVVVFFDGFGMWRIDDYTGFGSGGNACVAGSAVTVDEQFGSIAREIEVVGESFMGQEKPFSVAEIGRSTTICAVSDGMGEVLHLMVEPEKKLPMGYVVVIVGIA